GVSKQTEALDKLQNVACVVLRHGRRADYPRIEVRVRDLQQALELVELGLAELGDMPVRERPQDQVRLSEPAPPSAKGKLFQARVAIRPVHRPSRKGNWSRK